MAISQLSSTFSTELRAHDDLEYICLIDECIGRSVSNDAAAVVAYLGGTSHGLGFRPVIYCDTTGVWDGLAHDGHQFTGHFPIRATSATEAIESIPTPDPNSTGYDPR